MELYVDHKRVDTHRESDSRVTISLSRTLELTKGRGAEIEPILLPVTANNRTIFGDVEQPNSVAMFNQEEHCVQLMADGHILFDGVPMLIESISDERGGEYRVALLGFDRDWVRYAANTPLRKLPVDFSMHLTGSDVWRSWESDTMVRFLPVLRDHFEVLNPDNSFIPPIKGLGIEDYHPFINIKRLIERVVGERGYEVESNFFEGDLFSSLYMSGNYKSKETDSIRRLMDFRAGRFGSATATANWNGWVSADPGRVQNSIGNIVDTATATESRRGEFIEGVYTNGDFFTKREGAIVFIPPTKVKMAFEYTLFYTTDYRVEDRDSLKGFSIITLGDGINREVKLVNRNVDRRGSIETYYEYRLIIFDYNPTKEYQARHTITTGGVTTTISQSVFSSRSSPFLVKGSGRVVDVSLYERTKGTSTFSATKSDWVLYDGYVEEEGQIDVEVTLRSAPEELSPNKPKYFWDVMFGGAEQGMGFTINKSTTIRALFSNYPGLGARVSFEELAAHKISCLDVVEAVKQMFNLHFYTDHFEKRVYIEPHDDFYTDTVVDWSDKVDTTKPISVSELGEGLPAVTSYRYYTGDGAVNRWNVSRGEVFGQWDEEVKSRFTREQPATKMNLFSPSFSEELRYPDAPAAMMLRVGDRDISSVVKGDLNFEPKIVSYLGVVELPKNQYWGWPMELGSYPLLTFHHPKEIELGGGVTKEGFTLCYDDRDGVRGLNRFRSKSAEKINSSKQIELYINLGVEDIEPFVVLNRLQRDFRALYRVKINGEYIYCRLEEICDYDPRGDGSTKCIFTTES